MPSHRTPDSERLIAGVYRVLRERGVPFMLIGGQAVLLHGEPRLTRDIVVTFGIAADETSGVKDAAQEVGLEPPPEDPAGFVAETFVLPCEEPGTGVRVDFIFSTSPYEARAIDRPVEVAIRDASVPFAAAEVLIVHKPFAGRPRDLEDAAGVVRRKGKSWIGNTCVDGRRSSPKSPLARNCLIGWKSSARRPDERPVPQMRRT